MNVLLQSAVVQPHCKVRTYKNNHAELSITQTFLRTTGVILWLKMDILEESCPQGTGPIAVVCIRLEADDQSLKCILEQWRQVKIIWLARTKPAYK